MLDNVKQTILVIVSAVFAILGIWGVPVPIQEELVKQLIELIFVILGSIGIGAGIANLRALNSLDKFQKIQAHWVNKKK